MHTAKMYYCSSHFNVLSSSDFPTVFYIFIVKTLFLLYLLNSVQVQSPSQRAQSIAFDFSTLFNVDISTQFQLFPTLKTV